MGTKHVVPRAEGQGGIGTATLGWGELFITNTTNDSATQGGKLTLTSNDGDAMQSGSRLGVIEFKGAESSSALTIGARIEAICDAVWSATENGASLKFYTTDANASESLVLTLDSNKLAVFSGAVAITGNLTVNGTTTTVNSTIVTIDDPVFTLGGDTAPVSETTQDKGIEFRYHTGSAAKIGFFGWDDSASSFTFIADATNNSEVFSGTAGNAIFTNITGTLQTAAQTNITSVGALNGGTITSGFGAINNGASTITTTGLISGGSLDIDNVLINGTTIGHTDDTDLMTLSSGVLTVAGELDAISLDISGNADIDGTLEADAITVNGTALAEVISDTTGAMFSSNTETGVTVTYQDADNTIDVAINAAQTTVTSLLATDIKIGEDDQTKIDFETADEIHFYAANVEQVYLGNNIFGPQSNQDVDLGSSSVRWNNAFVHSINVQGTVTALALNIAGTSVTSNAGELNVLDGITAVVGELNTLDLGATAFGNALGSKAVVLDSNKDYSGIRNLTISGRANFNGNVNVVSANAEIWIGESTSGGGAGFLKWNDAGNYLYLGNSYNSAFNTDLVISSTGKVGIGTTTFESSWTGYTVLKIGADNSIYGNTATNAGSAFFISQNLYQDASNHKYVGAGSNEGGVIDLRNGTFTYSTAPAGTAGNNATITPRLSISNAGNATFSNYIDTPEVRQGGEFMIGRSSNIIRIGSGDSSDSLAFYAGASQRMSISSGGIVLIGTTNADVGGSVQGIRLGNDGRAIFAIDTGSLPHYISPVAADRRNNSGDGNMFSMWRQGIFKGAMGITGNDIVFKTGNNSSDAERMRISSGGLVQVGDGTSQNTFLTTKSVAGWYSGIKLTRGLGNGSSTANNNFGLLVSDGGLEVSTFTSPLDNVTGRSAKLTISSGGDTIITTTTNQGGLTITSATDNTTLRLVNTNASASGQDWRFYSTGGSSGLGVGKLFIKVGTTETAARLMSFVDGGSDIKMGIGIASPTSTLHVVGTVNVTSTKNFYIDHPLESKKDTHSLIHASVESPEVNNLYRGKVDLINGNATVNLDTVSSMTEGTFVALNNNAQCFTTNESDWDAVKGGVDGNELTISCQNSSSTANVSWMVISNRKDISIMESSGTDSNGKLIVEEVKVQDP